MKLRYFNINDFDSPDLKGSGGFMKVYVLQALDNARHWIEVNWNRRGKKRIVFIVPSGYRTDSHNEKVGGKPDSSHLKGLAVDIAYKNTFDAFVMLIALAMHGFFRFGIDTKRKFIHADMDKTKNPSIWTYNRGLLSILGINKNEDE